MGVTTVHFSHFTCAAPALSSFAHTISQTALSVVDFTSLPRTGLTRETKQGFLERPSRSEVDAAIAGVRREVADVSARVSANTDGVAAASRRAEASAALIEARSEFRSGLCSSRVCAQGFVLRQSKEHSLPAPNRRFPP